LLGKLAVMYSWLNKISISLNLIGKSLCMKTLKYWISIFWFSFYSFYRITKNKRKMPKKLAIFSKDGFKETTCHNAMFSVWRSKPKIHRNLKSLWKLFHSIATTIS
jgi:hypothetical protein